MIEILIITIMIEMVVIFLQSGKISEIEEKNTILQTENYSLKRVLRENDLIPKEYMK